MEINIQHRYPIDVVIRYLGYKRLGIAVITNGYTRQWYADPQYYPSVDGPHYISAQFQQNFFGKVTNVIEQVGVIYLRK